MNAGLTGPNLFTLEEGIEDKTGIRKHVAREGMYLLHTACIRPVGLAHARVADIVIRTIGPAVRVRRPNIRRGRVGKVIVNWAVGRTLSGQSVRDNTTGGLENDERSLTRVVSKCCTASFKGPSA
jgi:hypothetical protein